MTFQYNTLGAYYVLCEEMNYSSPWSVYHCLTMHKHIMFLVPGADITRVAIPLADAVPQSNYCEEENEQ